MRKGEQGEGERERRKKEDGGNTKFLEVSPIQLNIPTEMTYCEHEIKAKQAGICHDYQYFPL